MDIDNSIIGNHAMAQPYFCKAAKRLQINGVTVCLVFTPECWCTGLFLCRFLKSSSRMLTMKHLFLMLFVAIAPCTVASCEDLQLTVPPMIYAVPGVETAVYFDNLVLSQESDRYRFEVKCDVGVTGAKRWSYTPDASHAGTFQLVVSVFNRDAGDGKSEPLARAATTLKVVPANAGADHSLNLLIIGDSLTHATTYSNELARLLSQPANPKWRMLGTHKPSSAVDGVAHEGYGGWTWARFVSHFEPNPDGTYKKRSSPFVFLNEQQRPSLDVSRYFRESCDNQSPDYVIIMLGINDCFGAPADDAVGTDARIDAMFEQANILLNAIQTAAPATHLGLCLTTPPNSRQAAFEANYQDKYSRWGWKRIQHRLVQRQLQFVAEKQDARISIVPTELNLDPVGGYPDNNAVHPNQSGYKQIGASVYAWLKWRLTLDSIPPAP